MSLKSAILEIKDDTPTKVLEPEIRYVIEGVAVSIDSACEALVRKDEIIKDDSFSVENYHALKTWMYEKTAMVGIEFRLPITLEHEGNVKRLALEGIGEFFSKLWESIKAGFRWIFDLLKRLFGVSNEAKLKNYEHRIKILKEKAKELEQKRGLIDIQKAKSIFAESVKDNVAIDTIFSVMQNDPPSGITNFVMEYGNKLTKLAVLSDFTIGDSSFARSFAEFVWGKKESWHLSTLDKYDGYSGFISALKSNTASIKSHIPEDSNKSEVLKILAGIKSTPNSAIANIDLSSAQVITLTNFTSYKTHVLTFAGIEYSDEKVEYKKEIKQNITSLIDIQIELMKARTKYDVSMVDHHDLSSIQMLITKYVDQIKDNNNKLKISIDKAEQQFKDLNKINTALTVILNNGNYGELIVDSLKTISVMTKIFLQNMVCFQTMYVSETSLLETLVVYLDLCTKAYEKSINIE